VAAVFQLLFTDSMYAWCGALIMCMHAARGTAGLAPRAPVMPTMVGGGALALTTNPSALAAMEAAKKAAAGLGLAGANTGVPAEPDHFQEELEINDYPQHARWKATHRDRFLFLPSCCFLVGSCSSPRPRAPCACVFDSLCLCVR
jgi:hypothetical protein